MICHLFLSKFFVASEAPKSRNSRLSTGPVFNPSAFIPLICPADFMTFAIKNHKEERKERLAHSAVASCWTPVVPGAARPPSSLAPACLERGFPEFNVARFPHAESRFLTLIYLLVSCEEAVSFLKRLVPRRLGDCSLSF